MVMKGMHQQQCGVVVEIEVNLKPIFDLCDLKAMGWIQSALQNLETTFKVHLTVSKAGTEREMCGV